MQSTGLSQKSLICFFSSQKISMKKKARLNYHYTKLANNKIYININYKYFFWEPNVRVWGLLVSLVYWLVAKNY